MSEMCIRDSIYKWSDQWSDHFLIFDLMHVSGTHFAD